MLFRSRLGGKKSVFVNVRIIAATNRLLEVMVEKGDFRQDLYYRLYVFPIHLPPLRKRTQDIPGLTHHFVEQSCARLKITSLPILDSDIIKRLKAYAWPGNVRELENLIERAVILSQGGSLQIEKLLPIDPDKTQKSTPDKESIESLIDRRIQMAFEKKGGASDHSIDGKPFQISIPHGVIPLEDTIRDSIQAALSYCKGRINGTDGAAALLKLNPSTLRNKMRKLNINAKLWKIG